MMQLYIQVSAQIISTSQTLGPLIAMKGPYPIELIHDGTR